MSHSSRPVTSQDISDLIEAVGALSLRVEHLARTFEAQNTKKENDEWEVIEDISLPWWASEKDFAGIYTWRIAEDGPPPVPGFCLDSAQRNLRGVEPGPVVRANRAFKAGFWSKLALETCTPYRWADPIGISIGHWVVLRAGERVTPVRFNRKSDFNLFVAGIPEHDIVSESFASITELSIYCVGAGIRLPALKAWRKAN